MGSTLIGQLIPSPLTPGVLGPRLRGDDSDVVVGSHLTSDSHVKQPIEIGGNQSRYAFAISRRRAPEFCEGRLALVEKRARGTPDARCVRSLMRIKNKRTS